MFILKNDGSVEFITEMLPNGIETDVEFIYDIEYREYDEDCSLKFDIESIQMGEFVLNAESLSDDFKNHFEELFIEFHIENVGNYRDMNQQVQSAYYQEMENV